MSRSLERLVSNVRHHRGGRWLSPGDKFQAGEKEAAALVRHGFARRDMEAEKEIPDASRTRVRQEEAQAQAAEAHADESHEAAPVVEPAEEVVRPRRQYRRRDLEPEK